MGFIETLNIVQHSHHDIGYTDLPAVTGIIHRRNFAAAVELMVATRHLPDGERFCWTAETALPVLPWWRAASPAERRMLTELAEAGQFEVGAMAVHQNGYMNEDEWEWALNYLPPEVRGRLHCRTLIQIDVNGLPLGGAMKAAESGVEQVWMSPNSYMGFPLSPASQAFYWRLPDGKRLLVWQNDNYNNWEKLMFPEEWRRGPIPAWSDLQFRPPEVFDRYEPSEENVRRRHEFLLSQLAGLEAGCAGRYREIPVSCTNSYRLDNDPPTPGLPQFVRLWNELGLKPRLNLTTFSRAIRRVEETAPEIPEYSGSWPDWWANGMAAMPRPCIASRRAKRVRRQLSSPVLSGRPAADPLYGRAMHDLAIFDEHCYCSWSSASRPWSLLTEGATAEKTAYAYRAQAELELLRADALRAVVADMPVDNRVCLANLTSEPLSEYVPLRTEALRGEYAAARDERSGRVIPLIPAAGDRFFLPADNPEHFSAWNTPRVHQDRVPGAVKLLWSGELRPGEIRCYSLLRDAVPAVGSPLSQWRMELDRDGWPERVKHLPADQLFLRAGAGEFAMLTVAGDFKRTTYKAMFSGGKGEVVYSRAEFDACVREDFPETVEFRQVFRHGSLRRGERRMTVWKHVPRIRITCRIDRLEDPSPMVFTVKLPLGCAAELPRISAAGGFFTPFAEQLPGSCRDFFVTDDVIFYRKDKLALGTPDAGLFSFGAPRLLDRLTAPPPEINDVYSIVFHNFWDTNFAGNQYGVMEFSYDVFLTADRDEQAARRAAWSLASGLVPIVRCRD